MSCLFDSLSKLIPGIPDMRTHICDYIQTNKDLLLKNDSIKAWIINTCIDRYNEEHIDDQMIDMYVNDMRKRSECGGAPEIAIASKIFNVTIIVIPPSGTPIVFNNADDPNTSIQLNWTGNHYYV